MSTYSNSTHFSRPSLNDTTSKKISLIPSSGTNFHLQASSTVITSFVIPLYTHSFSADDLCLFIFENMGNRERNLESQENHQLIWCLPLLCCFSFYKWQMTFSYQSSLSPFVFWNPLAVFFFTSSLAVTSISLYLWDHFHQHSNMSYISLLKIQSLLMPHPFPIPTTFSLLPFTAKILQLSMVSLSTSSSFIPYSSYLDWIYNPTASPWLFLSKSSDQTPHCQILWSF